MEILILCLIKKQIECDQHSLMFIILREVRRLQVHDAEHRRPTVDLPAVGLSPEILVVLVPSRT
jgi:hypothetical protein